MDQPRTETKSKTEISFRPLSEGLGFHPFSDGLPYAPVSKGPRVSASIGSNLQPTAAPMGSGAVKAGPPQIAYRQPSPMRQDPAVPQISVPVAKQRLDFGKPATSSLSDGKAQAQKKATARSSFVGAPGRFYLSKRFLAYFLDFALNTILCGIALIVFALEQDFGLEALFNTDIVIFVTLFVLVMNWVLITLQEVSFKTSIGKRTVGLKLAGGRVQCLLRAIFFLPSVALLGIGIFQSLFDPKKRCWHDRQTNLQPFEYARF